MRSRQHYSPPLSEIMARLSRVNWRELTVAQTNLRSRHRRSLLPKQTPVVRSIFTLALPAHGSLHLAGLQWTRADRLRRLSRPFVAASGNVWAPDAARRAKGGAIRTLERPVTSNSFRDCRISDGRLEHRWNTSLERCGLLRTSTD
jgi:hypothetical protein